VTAIVFDYYAHNRGFLPSVLPQDQSLSAVLSNPLEGIILRILRVVGIYRSSIDLIVFLCRCGLICD